MFRNEGMSLHFVMGGDFVESWFFGAEGNIHGYGS
ncbi:hypothetical protein BMMGA3_12470 [Bacillus methanolicus MGA3]|uniref:Uncharacterized protein n=1 Tax=Bacillus methanolicus (strain MGA3 / ATCC 53907) TaxID=796606 RepID=A0A068LZD4_BACMM|nr:hypothetical protein BMMGA3_12470 [Bacillus methanolicus MGA3]